MSSNASSSSISSNKTKKWKRNWNNLVTFRRRNLEDIYSRPQANDILLSLKDSSKIVVKVPTNMEDSNTIVVEEFSEEQSLQRDTGKEQVKDKLKPDKRDNMDRSPQRNIKIDKTEKLYKEEDDDLIKHDRHLENDVDNDNNSSILNNIINESNPNLDKLIVYSSYHELEGDD